MSLLNYVYIIGCDLQMLKFILVVLFIFKIICERQIVSDSGSVMMKRLYEISSKSNNTKCDVNTNKRGIKNNLQNIQDRIIEGYTNGNEEISLIAPNYEKIKKSKIEDKKTKLMFGGSRILSGKIKINDRTNQREENDRVVNYISNGKENVKSECLNDLRKFRGKESGRMKKGKTIQVHISLPGPITRKTVAINKSNYQKSFYLNPFQHRKNNSFLPLNGKPWYDQRNSIEERSGEEERDMGSDGLMVSSYRSDTRFQCAPNIDSGVTNKYHIRGPTVLADDEPPNDSVSLLYTLINLNTLGPKMKHKYTNSYAKKKITLEDHCKHDGKTVSKKKTTTSFKPSTLLSTTHKTKRSTKINHSKRTTCISLRHDSKPIQLTTFKSSTLTRPSKWAKVDKGSRKHLFTSRRPTLAETVNSNIIHFSPENLNAKMHSTSAASNFSTLSTESCVTFLPNINTSVIQENVTNQSKTSKFNNLISTTTHLFLKKMSTVSNPSLIETTLNKSKAVMAEYNAIKNTPTDNRKGETNKHKFSTLECKNNKLNIIIEQLDEESTSNNLTTTSVPSFSFTKGENGKERTLSSLTTNQTSSLGYPSKFDLPLHITSTSSRTSSMLNIMELSLESDTQQNKNLTSQYSNNNTPKVQEYSGIISNDTKIPFIITTAEPKNDVSSGNAEELTKSHLQVSSLSSENTVHGGNTANSKSDWFNEFTTKEISTEFRGYSLAENTSAEIGTPEREPADSITHSLSFGVLLANYTNTASNMDISYSVEPSNGSVVPISSLVNTYNIELSTENTSVGGKITKPDQFTRFATRYTLTEVEGNAVSGDNSTQTDTERQEPSIAITFSQYFPSIVLEKNYTNEAAAFGISRSSMETVSAAAPTSTGKENEIISVSKGSENLDIITSMKNPPEMIPKSTLVNIYSVLSIENTQFREKITTLDQFNGLTEISISTEKSTERPTTSNDVGNTNSLISLQISAETNNSTFNVQNTELLSLSQHNEEKLTIKLPEDKEAKGFNSDHQTESIESSSELSASPKQFENISEKPSPTGELQSFTYIKPVHPVSNVPKYTESVKLKLSSDFQAITSSSHGPVPPGPENIKSLNNSEEMLKFTYSVPINAVSEKPEYIVTLFNKPNETNFGICADLSNLSENLQDDQHREIKHGCLNNSIVQAQQKNNLKSVSETSCGTDENVSDVTQSSTLCPSDTVEESLKIKSKERVSYSIDKLPPSTSRVNQSLLIGYLKPRTTKKFATVCKGKIHIYFTEAPEFDNADKCLVALSKMISNLATTDKISHSHHKNDRDNE